MPAYALVLHGGRVIDPETGFDAICDVGVDGGTIAAISTAPLQGRRVLDVTNRVVAPGFIDLHSHCFGITGQRLQAFDGITTALELELGVHPIDRAYQLAALRGLGGGTASRQDREAVERSPHRWAYRLGSTRMADRGQP